MLFLSLGHLSTWTLLSISLLLSSASSWPTYHKRQSSDTPPGGQIPDPTFEEEYDFVIAGGVYNSLPTVQLETNADQS